MTNDKPSKPVDAPAPPEGATSNVAPFAATGRGKPCPICGRPSTVEMRPFCSKRCADIDLGRWLGEAYRIPTADPASPEDDIQTPPAGPPKP
ncbi:MAG: DNA gyrase inhibitor YacG [Gemmatimonas sp.]